MSISSSRTNWNTRKGYFVWPCRRGGSKPIYQTCPPQHVDNSYVCHSNNSHLPQTWHASHRASTAKTAWWCWNTRSCNRRSCHEDEGNLGTCRCCNDHYKESYYNHATFQQKNEWDTHRGVKHRTSWNWTMFSVVIWLNSSLDLIVS